MKHDIYYDSYEYGGHKEYILTAAPHNFGSDDKSHILFIPPFFAEMNKMRHTLVQAMRLIAEANIKVSLPDLPGCHESSADLRMQSLRHWQDAMQACAQQHKISHIVSFRAGSLIDSWDIDKGGLPIWRLNSIKGASILKTMLRSKIISQKESGHDISIEILTQQAIASGIELAGYDINADMFTQLQNAAPADRKNIYEAKLGQDIKGTSLWMRSEPEYDGDMADNLAKALVSWCNGNRP